DDLPIFLVELQAERGSDLHPEAEGTLQRFHSLRTESPSLVAPGAHDLLDPRVEPLHVVPIDDPLGTGARMSVPLHQTIGEGHTVAVRGPPTGPARLV